MFVIEFCGPMQIKPGRFRSTCGGKRFRRCWWLFVALTWFEGDLKDYHDIVASGATSWITLTD